MNIFYLDSDAETCARYHCDKHVVKMILETAQLLCGAHTSLGRTAPYALSHRNHPCAIWVRSSLSNYEWLCELGIALCREYTHRYEKVHKSEVVIRWAQLTPPPITDLGFTMPPQAMPDMYRYINNSVLAYREYYRKEKLVFSTWKKREIPSWI